MNYLFLALTVLGIAGQNVSRKEYERRFHEAKSAVRFYNLFTVLFAVAAVGVAACFSCSINRESLPYAFGWGACFAIATLFMYYSVQTGALSLSVLVLQFSLILPTFYGICFLSERLTVCGIIGLVLLAVSMVSVNVPKKGEKISWKWVIFALLTFLGNGFASIMQKLHQIRYPGQYQTAFLLIGFSLAAIIYAVLFFVPRPPKDELKPLFRRGILFPAIGGLLNGGANILVMILASRIPAAIMFPVISAGGIVITFILSLVLYRERLSVIGYIGYALGIASVILLNL